jgi:hypothetical protein
MSAIKSLHLLPSLLRSLARDYHTNGFPEFDRFHPEITSGTAPGVGTKYLFRYFASERYDSEKSKGIVLHCISNQPRMIEPNELPTAPLRDLEPDTFAELFDKGKHLIGSPNYFPAFLLGIVE